MVIRLGRNGRFLACSLYPEHKETRPLPGEEPETIGRRGRRRDVPGVRPGRAGCEARPVRAVCRLLALPRLQVHPQDRPAAARPAAVRGHVPQVQRGPAHRAASAPNGQRLLGLLALSEVRLHVVARADSARSTTRTTDPSRANGDEGAGICLKCGAPDRAAGAGRSSARSCPAASPIPEALAPRRRGRGGGRAAVAAAAAGRGARKPARGRSRTNERSAPRASAA